MRERYAKSTPRPVASFHLNWRSEGPAIAPSTRTGTWSGYFNFHNERGLALHQYALPGRPGRATTRAPAGGGTRAGSTDWGEGWLLDERGWEMRRAGYAALDYRSVRLQRFAALAQCDGPSPAGRDPERGFPFLAHTAHALMRDREPAKAYWARRPSRQADRTPTGPCEGGVGAGVEAARGMVSKKGRRDVPPGNSLPGAFCFSRTKIRVLSSRIRLTAEALPPTGLHSPAQGYGPEAEAESRLRFALNHDALTLDPPGG